MNRRAKLLLSLIVLAVAVTLVFTRLVPSYIANKIRALDNADARFSLDTVHVSPTLTVTIARVNIQSAFVEGHCEGITAKPALFRSLNEPTLRRLDVAHCETREPQSAPEAAAVDTPSDARDLKTLLDALLQESAKGLQKLGERIDHLRVERVSHHQRISMGETRHDIYINLHKLSFDEPFFGDRVLRFNLAMSGLVEIPNAQASLRGHGRGLDALLHFDDAVQVAGHHATIREVTLKDSDVLTVRDISSSELHPRIDALSLETLTVFLNENWRAELRNGVVQLAADEVPSARSPRAARRPVLSEEEARRERRRRLLDETTPAPPEDLWSMRMLARARGLVAALDEARFQAGELLPRLPAEVRIQDIRVMRGEAQVASLDDFRVHPDGEFGGDFGVGNATFTLEPDEKANQSPHKARRGQWVLHANDVRLSRLAVLFDLEKHVEGTLNAHIRIGLSDGVLHLNGPFHVANGRLEHPGLSPKALEAIELDGSVDIIIPAARADAARIRVDTNVNTIPTRALVTFTPEKDRARVRASFEIPERVECQRIWDAFPAGLVPDLGKNGVTFEGSAQPSLSLDYLPGYFQTFQLAASGFPDTCTIRISSPRYNPQQLLSSRYIHYVTEGVTVDDIRVGPGTRSWAPIQQLPRYIPAVMYLSEEINFPGNRGISLGLINKAIRYSLPRERFAYGGSTVTQQLVKNLFFTRDKHLARKFQEAFVVWAVESTLSKDRILELYLNCIEFGPNLYGIERASQYYFAKSASQLTPLEAAWLAGLKPSPGRGRRDWQRGYSDLDNWNSERIRELLQRLDRFGRFITSEEVDAAWPYVVYFPTSPNAGARPTGIDTLVRPETAGELTTRPDAGALPDPFPQGPPTNAPTIMPLDEEPRERGPLEEAL